MNEFIANKNDFNNSIVGITLREKNITDAEIVSKSKDILYVALSAIAEFDTLNANILDNKNVVYEYNQAAKAYNEIRTIIEPIMENISKQDYCKWADSNVKLSVKYKRVIALRDIIMRYTNICLSSLELIAEQKEIISNIKKARQ